MATEQPSKSRRPPPDGLTRSQVARQLGVGVTAVHHMRLRGDLRPKRDAAGVWRYDPAEVRRLYKEWQSSLDDPPPTPEPSGPGLLDEDPRADEAFVRAMAQAAGL